MSSDLENMLLAGNSRFNVDMVTAQIGTDEKLFGQLIDLMLNGKSPVPQRAAWVVSAVTDKYDWIITPYLNELIEALPSFNPPGLTRSLLRYLAKSEVPSNKIGELFEYCFTLFNDKKQPVAIRMFAMQILYNISEKEPDLKAELILVFESHLIEASPGVTSRGKKLLKKLKNEI